MLKRVRNLFMSSEYIYHSTYRNKSYIQTTTGLYNICSAIDHERNLFSVRGFRFQDRSYCIIFTIDGYFVTKFALGIDIELIATMRFSVYSSFSDNQIMFEISSQEIHLYSDYGMNVRQYEGVILDSDRDGNVYINLHDYNFIAIYDSQLEFKRYFRDSHFNMRRNEYFIIQSDLIFYIEKCRKLRPEKYAFMRKPTNSWYQVNIYSLTTEELLRTMPIGIQLSLNLCCIDRFGNILVDTELNCCSVCYSDGRVRLYQLENAINDQFSTLGYSITNDFQLIRVFQDVVRVYSMI